MIEIWLLFLVIHSAIILVILLGRKEQEHSKAMRIRFKDDGEQRVQEALVKLEDARKTAAANQPK